MRTQLTKEQAVDLLEFLQCDKIGVWKGSKISCCCPVHGERHPSFGINIDFCPDEAPNLHACVFNCFSCGAHGTIPWLLVQTEVCKNVREAEQFIKDRYGVTFTFKTDDSGNFVLTRFEDKYDIPEYKRTVLPPSTIAPFKSGKETYQYFFDRGLDKEDMKKFMIGRDLVNETITMPVFWEDNSLAGVIGRYIDPGRRKNERFKIYEFKRGDLIYPLNYLQTVNDTLIGVESQIDCMLLHKWGFPNAFSIMGNKMSDKQATIIARRCRKMIALFDLDDGGGKALKSAREKLRGRCLVVTPTYYPEEGKDPSDFGELETVRVIKSAQAGRMKLPRY